METLLTEQVFNGDGAERIDAGPAGGEVIHRGDLQHRDRLALQLSHDAAAFAAGQRGDRQQHLIELLVDLAQHLGRLDRDAVDRAPPETGRIIEKGHDLVCHPGADSSQSRIQLLRGGIGRRNITPRPANSSINSALRQARRSRARLPT